MAIEQAKRAIQSFLESEEAEVLALTGDWGIGKTYLWSVAINELKNRSTTDKPLRSSYVSLFGVKDIESLKLSIFENIDGLAPTPADEGSESGWNIKKIFGGGRKAARAISQAQIVKNWTGSVVQDIAFSYVRNLVICIDDFERRSPSLLTREVLGLVSYLKEHRGCKIALIFNPEELDGCEDYDHYKEKVVDRQLTLDPRPEEAIEVAIPRADDLAVQLKQHAQKLGIRNIRVLRKIDKLAIATSLLLKDLHPTISKQAIASIVLFSWSYYCPGKGPTLAFLRGLKDRFIGWSSFMGKEEKEDTPEKRWVELLEDYGYLNTDALDLCLITAVEQGYLDEDAVLSAATLLDADLKVNDRRERISAAWALFRNSFDENEAEIVDALIEAIRGHLDYANVGELNSVVMLLRDLGRNELADELIEEFVTTNAGQKERFNLETGFPGDKFDEAIQKRLPMEYASLDVPKPLSDSLMALSDRSGGWCSSDEKGVLAASDEELFDLILKTRGDDLP